MKPNRGREPSPVTTSDANAPRLAESSFLCVFADECRGSARRTERRFPFTRRVALCHSGEVVRSAPGSFTQRVTAGRSRCQPMRYLAAPAR